MMTKRRFEPEGKQAKVSEVLARSKQIETEREREREMKREVSGLDFVGFRTSARPLTTADPSTSSLEGMKTQRDEIDKIKLKK